MLKVNNKDAKICFMPCSSVSIGNFEHVNADWEGSGQNISKALVRVHEELLMLVSSNHVNTIKKSKPGISACLISIIL